MRGGRRARPRARGRGVCSCNIVYMIVYAEVCGDTLKPYRCRENIYQYYICNSSPPIYTSHITPPRP